MKALTITKSPKVMRPSTTPCVARHNMAIKATAMISCCPVLSKLRLVCAFKRARRS